MMRNPIVQFAIIGLIVPLASIGSILSPAKILWQQRGVDGRIEEAVVSADEQVKAFRLADGRVVIRDNEKIDEPVVFENRPYAVTGLAMTPDGDYVLWADNSGRIFSWNKESGLAERFLERGALKMSRTTADGSRIAVAGDGDSLFILDTRGLSGDSYLLNAEQSCAMAISPAGEFVLHGDHSGQLTCLSDDGTIESSRKVSEAGIRGICLVPGESSRLAVWDDDGVLYLLSLETFEEEARRELLQEEINIQMLDESGNRLYIGGLNTLYVVSLDEILTVNEAYLFPSSVVSISKLDTGSVQLITQEGLEWSLDDGILEQTGRPVSIGTKVRIQSGIQTGIASIESDIWNDQVDLATGEVITSWPKLSEQVLSRGSLHSGEEVVWLELTLNEDGLVLQAEGIPEVSFDDWTPDTLATGSWSPRVALMSGNGRVEILELITGVTPEWNRLLLLDADTRQVWWHAEFTNRDETLLVHGREHITVVDIASGEVFQHQAPASMDVTSVAYSKGRETLYYSSNYSLYEWDFESGQGRMIYETIDESPILALYIRSDDPIIELWSTTLYCEVKMDDPGYSYSIFTYPAQLRAVTPTVDGPFATLVTNAGDLMLEQAPFSLLNPVFPELYPASGGGMTTGYFGSIKAAYGSWISHQTYGWGEVNRVGLVDWFWFDGEGWLAGGAGMHPYMYSMDHNAWYFCLMPLYDTPWIYDYGIMEWRKFGE